MCAERCEGPTEVQKLLLRHCCVLLVGPRWVDWARVVPRVLAFVVVTVLHLVGSDAAACPVHPVVSAALLQGGNRGVRMADSGEGGVPSHVLFTPARRCRERACRGLGRLRAVRRGESGEDKNV